MKQNYLRSLKRTTAFVPAMLLAANFVHANPLDGQVVAGNATITTPSLDMLLIQQTTNNAIINWKSFDIGVGETTQFVVPDYTSVTLNRVVGSQDPSKILGTLKSNGTVMVVNPDGILFGPNSVVDVGGLLATTADIEDADFMAKNYQFTKPGKSTASIVNQGMITVKDEGIAALVAPGVRNEGVITAKLGKVTLGAANKFSLDFYGDDLIKLMLDDTLEGDVISTATGKPLSDKVANTGKISADGGTVVLKAATARKVVNSVINNTGVIEANSVGVKDGKIMLFAATATTKQSDAPVQSVKVTGTLSASGKKKGEKGGKILVTGEAVEVSSAKIDASGDAGGGAVLIGGDYLGHKATDAELAALGISWESFVLSNATFVSLDDATSINVDAVTEGNGGKAVVFADGHTDFTGSVTSRGGQKGGNGGFVEVSGHDTLNFDGRVDLSAYDGIDGTLLLDPTNVVIGGTGATGLSASAIINALVTSNVIVKTGASGTQAGDITVASNIQWNSNHSLTLEAYHNIIGNAGVSIKNTGAGDLRLRADSTGIGSGTVIGNGASFVDYSQSTGKVELFYNPTGPNKYLHPTDFSSHFLGNPAIANQAVAYMLINSVSDLQLNQGLLSGNYALGRDINASGQILTQAFGQTGSPFTGHFNGDFKTISNLTMNMSGTFGGLIGLTSSSAIIENVYIKNATLSGVSAFSGIVVGENHGTIRQVSVDGTITHDAAYAGMVAGVNFGNIDQVSASGNLNWVDVAFGYNTVGGFVGSNESGAVISNSFSHANVNGVGPGSTKTGFAGFNRFGTILNSYSTGSSNGGPGFEAEYSGSVTTNGYWDTDSSGVSYSAGGVGLTTAQLKSGLPTGFSSTFWAIDPAVNGGYPYLKWQVPAAVVTTTLGPGTFVGPVVSPAILNPNSNPTLQQAGQSYFDKLAEAACLSGTGPCALLDLGTVKSPVFEKTIWKGLAGPTDLDQLLDDISPLILAADAVYYGKSVDGVAPISWKLFPLSPGQGLLDTARNVVLTEIADLLGFNASVYDFGGKIIISFEGSGSVLSSSAFNDWLGNNVPNAMLAEIRKATNVDLANTSDLAHLQQVFGYLLTLNVIAQNPSSKIYLTGHSLGGGIAAYAGAQLRLPTVTFNAAATSFSANESYDPSYVLNLQIKNDIAGIGGTQVGSTLVFDQQLGSGISDRHSMKNFTQILQLSQGKKTSLYTQVSVIQ